MSIPASADRSEGKHPKHISPQVGDYLKWSVGKWSQPDRIYKSGLNFPNECTRSPKCHGSRFWPAHMCLNRTQICETNIPPENTPFLLTCPPWTIWINRDLENTPYRIKRSIMVSIFQTNSPRCLSWKNHTFHFRANSHMWTEYIFSWNKRIFFWSKNFSRK